MLDRASGILTVKWMPLPRRLKLFARHSFLKLLLYFCYSFWNTGCRCSRKERCVCGNKHRRRPFACRKYTACLLLCSIYRDGKHGGRESCNPLGERMKASSDIDMEESGESGVGVKIHFGKKSQDWPGAALNSVNWSISLKSCASTPKGPWLLFSLLCIQVLLARIEVMKQGLSVIQVHKHKGYFNIPSNHFHVVLQISRIKVMLQLFLELLVPPSGTFTMSGCQLYPWPQPSQMLIQQTLPWIALKGWY